MCYVQHMDKFPTVSPIPVPAGGHILGVWSAIGGSPYLNKPPESKRGSNLVETCTAMSMRRIIRTRPARYNIHD